MVSKSNKISIVGVAIVSPVGWDINTTYTAVQAEINVFQDVNYYDADYNNIKMATIPEDLLSESLNELIIQGVLHHKHARMLMIASLAIKQIGTSINIDRAIPLFLSASEHIDHSTPVIDRVFIENLALQSEIQIDLVNSQIVQTGRSGGIEALAYAIKYLDESDCEYVIVGGVDTFYDNETLQYLQKQERLLTVNAEDGFVPGEGAAFIVLTKTNRSAGIGTPFIFNFGFSYEDGHLLGDEPYRGEGLAKAVKDALAGTAGVKIQTIYSSMNGENYFAKEFGVMLIRNHKAFVENVETRHPADCYGDLGAASGLAMICLACKDIEKKGRKWPYLIYCSSDGGNRSAVIISV